MAEEAIYDIVQVHGDQLMEEEIGFVDLGDK